MKTTTTFAFLSLALSCMSAAYADTFGTGSNLFDIEFVTVGNPGNANDPDDGDSQGGIQNFGSVPYTYRMGKFEISEDMIDKANAEGSLGIAQSNRGADQPATLITWFEAARFINWLNTSMGSTPAYKFAVQPGEVGYSTTASIELWAMSDTGYNPNNLYRNSLATYFLPSVDEWYKAAYYDPNGSVYYDYPTGSDSAPANVASGTAADTAVWNQTGPADITQAGGLSPYGTMGQGGNVWEWEETEKDLVNDSPSLTRGFRGGAYDQGFAETLATHRNGGAPTVEILSFGVRVAAISLTANCDSGCDGNFDGDFDVDGDDLTIWEQNYGLSDPFGHDVHEFGDADGDARIAGTDFLLWQQEFGTGVGQLSAPTAVPEPTTSALALVALCLAMSRRRIR